MGNVIKPWSLAQGVHARVVESLPEGLSATEFRLAVDADRGKYTFYIRVEKGSEHHDLSLALSSWTVGDSLDASDFFIDKIRTLPWGRT